MTVRNWLVIGLATLAVLGAAGGYYMYQGSSQGFYVLTPAEVAELAEQEPEAEAENELTRGVRMTKADGPNIKFRSPNNDVLASPVNIDVNIQPKDGVAVDMRSIRIDYKMGPGWINVTNRIMKHASVKGSRLYAKAAELPAGKHTMRLSVKDGQKRQTQAVVSFVVR
ncbi:MAG: hypothetical protein AB3N23_02955 [Paracoccaceae bacterium]